jgi:L-amino acid N-acyltransferase
MNIQFKIRIATEADLPAIVDIYNQAIKTLEVTGDLKEFKVDERRNWFKKFDVNSYPMYVAVANNKVVGYASLSPYRPGREAMSKIAEISFYIDYSFHRQGIASELIKYVISDCQRINKEVLIAILIDANTGSTRILKNFNFKKWGHFPNILEMGGIKYGHLIYGLNIKK